MDVLQTVWDACDFFTKNSLDVKIEWENINKMAPTLEAIKLPQWTYPEFIHTPEDLALYELTACSINYCYWYGVGYYRPNGCNSYKMYELLNESYVANGYKWDKNLIETLIAKLAINRFPLIEQRAKHLRELEKEGKAFSQRVVEGGSLVNNYLPELITLFPGFGGDLFLKRAFLYFIQIDRKLNYFNNEIGLLPIPADYQIPKVLRHKNLISYSPSLAKKIDDCELISSSSRLECEIRASSILACKKLSEISGAKQNGFNFKESIQNNLSEINTPKPKLTMADIDIWLWTSRKETNDQFHLTVTTDY